MSERSLSSPTNIPIFKPYRPYLYPPYILYLSYCHAYVSLLPILWQLTAKLLADYCQAVGSNRGKASLSHSISTKGQKKKILMYLMYLCQKLSLFLRQKNRRKKLYNLLQFRKHCLPLWRTSSHCARSARHFDCSFLYRITTSKRRKRAILEQANYIGVCAIQA